MKETGACNRPNPLPKGGRPPLLSTCQTELVGSTLPVQARSGGVRGRSSPPELREAQTAVVSSPRRHLWLLPWILALAGLAVPMVGGGFVGWPFVVGWLVVLLLVWWVRPLGGASRAVRLGTGVGVCGLLALLGTVGGFYLIPAVLAWIALTASQP